MRFVGVFALFFLFPVAAHAATIARYEFTSEYDSTYDDPVFALGLDPATDPASLRLSGWLDVRIPTTTDHRQGLDAIDLGVVNFTLRVTSGDIEVARFLGRSPRAGVRQLQNITDFVVTSRNPITTAPNFSDAIMEINTQYRPAWSWGDYVDSLPSANLLNSYYDNGYIIVQMQTDPSTWTEGPPEIIGTGITFLDPYYRDVAGCINSSGTQSGCSVPTELAPVPLPATGLMLLAVLIGSGVTASRYNRSEQISDA